MTAGALRGKPLLPSAQELRAQNDLGLVAMLSGSNEFQRVGSALSSEATGLIKAMEANKLKEQSQRALEKYWEQQDERARIKEENTRKYREQQLAMMQGRNEALLADRDRKLRERNIMKLSDRLEKSGVIPLGQKVKTVMDKLADQGVTLDDATGKWNIPGDIEGLGGMANIPIWTTLTGSERAKQTKAAIEDLRGYLRKIISGTAVSSQEMKAEAERIMLNPMNTEADFLSALASMRRAYMDQAAGILGGQVDVKDEYLRNLQELGGSLYGFDPVQAHDSAPFQPTAPGETGPWERQW